nr:retrovirus-related Pol polyprotein from transposon TNT 1-94 [Tanacetum cinerariifolium]
NKTPYELFNGRTPAIGFLKPFGCHVTILNTLDNLGKLEAKGDEEPSSEARLISKRVANQEETPSLDNILSLTNSVQNDGRAKFIATIHQKTDPALLQFCLFSYFLSQVEPKKVSDALQDPSWVEAMQEELLQFQIQKVWTLVDCPKVVRPIGTKWVLKNKRDERGIALRNKARLVA